MDSTAPEASGLDATLLADLKALTSDDLFTREQAVVRVAQRGTPVAQTLIGILGDFAKPGLAGVAKALGKIGDERAIPILGQAAKMGDEELRIAAVWALSQLSDPVVLPILLTEAERPHPLIQSYLASILGTFQDSRVVPVLSKLAVHPNREVSFQAVCALGEVGGQAGIPVLKKAWRRNDSLVRAASAASLRRLGSRPARFSAATLVLIFGAIFFLIAGAGWFFYPGSFH